MNHSNVPYVVAEAESWALVYKPHNMATAPLVDNEAGTLLEWIISHYPQAVKVRGKKPIEHGLVHRLDTATEGLVLVALNQSCYEHFKAEQAAGKIVKAYEAGCSFNGKNRIEKFPFVIESRFKPFGKGRKIVKPLFPGDRQFDTAGKDYRTVIRQINGDGKQYTIRCEIVSGFRHQIRAHLSYLGYPIVGDPLYNPDPGNGNLELAAVTIGFTDPDSSREVFFSLHGQDKTNP